MSGAPWLANLENWRQIMAAKAALETANARIADLERELEVLHTHVEALLPQVLGDSVT